MNALNFADWLIYRFDKANFDISPRRLQRLLYLAQGSSYHFSGKPLFEDDFVKMPDGPCVLEVEEHYPERHFDSTQEVSDRELCVLSPFEEEMLEKIFLEYGDLSAAQLRKLSHDRAWKAAKMGEVIPKEKIQEIFDIDIRHLLIAEEIKRRKPPGRLASG